jgi:hypothetical protein
MLLDFSASLHSARNDGCAFYLLPVISTVAERSLSQAYQLVIYAFEHIRDCSVVSPRNKEIARN